MADVLAPFLGADASFGCQDYEVGQCGEFYGFDGDAPQKYNLHFVGCQGEIPALQCDRHSRLERNAAAPLHKVDLAYASQSEFAGMVGVAGAGLLVLASVMRLRRYTAPEVPAEISL
jgi:hypothetical protein